MYSTSHYPSGNYLLSVNNRNIRTSCNICSKLSIKTPERRQWRRSGAFIVHFIHLVLLLTLDMQLPPGLATYTRLYLGPSQTSMMHLYAKIFN